MTRRGGSRARTFKPMTPEECRAFLRRLERFGIKLGLDNVRTLLRALGDPQAGFAAVHVAGTNGKGSVCAMLASALRAHGLRVGLFTSPHLVEVRERIRIGGQLISWRDFGRLLARVRETSDALLAAGKLAAHPTYFEVLTTLAFLHFAARKVDIAVLETGMGGRFDATNVINPLITVITSIAKDHQEHLGDTLAAIAFEKAGIIKPGVPVICAVERGPALAVIRRRAKELGAPFVPVFGPGSDFRAERTARGHRFTFSFDGQRHSLRPGLRGAHQGRNAAAALVAAILVGKRWRSLDRRLILQGIARVRWEGRLEAVGRRPLVLLDGAHNEEGALALAAYVQTLRGPLTLVFAVMKDKAVRRVAEALFRPPRRVVLTSIPFARACRPEEVAALARPFRRKIVLEPDLAQALALARRGAGPKGTVLVAGSLYLVGEVKKLLRQA